jgi:hypothetical protein
VAPGGRQDLVQAADRVLGQRRQLAAARDEGVGGDDAGPAGVRDDREAPALRARLLCEHLGHAEQLGDAVDAEHADTPEGGVQDVIGPGQRPGVRGRGPGGLLGATGLDDDDRLGERHLPRGRQEGARVADRLHVDDDALRARVVAEVVDDVAPADVEHRAEGGDGAEAVCSRFAQSSTAVTSAPDWLTKPTLPRPAMPFAKVALNPATGFMIPRQFGPTIRIPLARAVSRMRPSSARPSGPVSLKPAEMMIAARPRPPRTPR